MVPRGEELMSVCFVDVRMCAGGCAVLWREQEGGLRDGLGFLARSKNGRGNVFAEFAGLRPEMQSLQPESGLHS